MISQDGSYMDKSYIDTPIATLLCGALLLSGGAGIIDNSSSVEQSNNYGYYLEESGTNIQDEAYQVPAQTWSPVEDMIQIEMSVPDAAEINVTESLQVINNLAFLTVNEDVDNEIERYFASKPVKTKTILINHRINQG